jgi:hypothetical protein
MQKRKEMKTTAYAGAGGWRMRMFVLLAAVVAALVGVLMVGQRSASALPAHTTISYRERSS